MIPITFDECLLSISVKGDQEHLLPYIITKHIALCYEITCRFPMKEEMAVSMWCMFIHSWHLERASLLTLFPFVLRIACCQESIFRVHLQCHLFHEAFAETLSPCVLVLPFLWALTTLNTCFFVLGTDCIWFRIIVICVLFLPTSSQSTNQETLTQSFNSLHNLTYNLAHSRPFHSHLWSESLTA